MEEKTESRSKDFSQVGKPAMQDLSKFLPIVAGLVCRETVITPG